MCRVLAGDGLGPVAPALELGKRLATRLSLAGGELVLRVGSSVGASFDGLELLEVVDLALQALGEARTDPTGVGLSCSLTLGELERDAGTVIGGAIDRALVLAGRSDAFELVLDDPARAQADAALLFARSVTERGMPSAHVVDARYPHRAPCRRQLTRLSTAILPEA